MTLALTAMPVGTTTPTAADAAAAAIADHGDLLARYVPRWVRKVAGAAAAGNLPHVEPLQGAVLFLDIAGFSKLTERFGQQGRQGAEDLTGVLDHHFGTIAGLVEGCGGDVIAYAGDAVLAFWPDNADHNGCLRAAAAALEISRLPSTTRDGAEPFAFRHRTAIETGPLSGCIVGEAGGRRHPVLLGLPVARLGGLRRQADPGQIILGPAAVAQLSDTAEIRRKADGSGELQRLRGDVLRAEARRREEAPPEAALLSGFVPMLVRDRIAAGQANWLAEFRMISVVFVALELDTDRPASAAERLQITVLAVERVLRRLEGTIYQIIMDDRGVSLIVAFGLPPLAHDNDAAYSVEAAFAIRDVLEDSAEKTAIAIGTGSLLCSDYGGSRRQYAMMGPAINLAAQITTVARNDIVCDEATARAARRRIAFTVLHRLPRKSGGGDSMLYRPHRPPAPVEPQRHGRLIGRAAETAVLQDHLRTLAESGAGGVVLTIGEPGIGKSHLLHDFVNRAERSGVRVLCATASPFELSTPYFLWQQALRQLSSQNDRASLLHSLKTLAGNCDPHASWLPLLSDVLDIDLEDTAITRAISGAARADAIRDLMVHLLTQAAIAGPMALVFDDIHWMDAMSAKVLDAVKQRCGRLLIVLGGRPVPADTQAWTGPQDPSTVIRINLAPLDRDAIGRLIGQRFGVAGTAEPLLDLVQAQAEGNPLFSEELVLALHEHGLVAVGEDICALAAPPERLPHTVLAESVHGTIVSRIDRLPAQAQLILKVASVAGHDFPEALLRDIATMVATDGGPNLTDDLDEMLDLLVRQGLLVRQDAADLYAFRHAIGQEATYNMLLFTQRRQFHRDIALWLEKQHARGLHPYLAQLALHWERAEEPAMAIDYLERAGKAAARRHANHAAIDFLTRATDLAMQERMPIPAPRRAVWEDLLGEARYGLFERDAAVSHFARAMRLIGRPVPASRGATLLHSCGALAVQSGRRAGLLRRRSSGDDTQRDRMAARIYLRLAEKAYLDNEPLPVLHHTLATMNLAERAHSVPEMVSGYAALAVGLSLAGMSKTASAYSRRSLVLAEAEGSLADIAYAHLLAHVYGSNIADWPLAIGSGRKAIELFTRLGDQNRSLGTLMGLFHGHFVSGQLDMARQVLADHRRLAAKGAPDQIRLWIDCEQTYLDLVDGTALDDDLALLSRFDYRNVDRVDRLVRCGLLALGWHRTGGHANAREAAKEGLALLQGQAPTIAGCAVMAIAGIGEVLAAEAASNREDPTAFQEAAQACHALRRHARQVPMARPRYLMVRGRLTWLRGRRRRACHEWNLAARQAHRLGMPLEVGQALGLLGAHLDDRVARRRALQEACGVLREMGAADDLDRAACALAALGEEQT